ncbi:MAG TPA: vitamin K epoxide reductase family protein [Deinococcales bacterium]|nr:vitamin K epoxide reductase family protein [Deinococcales bacterium]
MTSFWGAVTVLLALAGVYVSAYFTLVAYRFVKPDAYWMPQVCRMDERSCGTVVHTRYGHLFLVPNGVWGVLWYALLLASELWGLTGTLRPLLLAGSALTVAAAVYLIWALDRKLGVFCVLCYASHGINALIFLLLLWR